MASRPPEARGIRSGIRRLFRLRPRSPDRVAADVDDEIALHIELRVERLVQHGLAPDVARAEAERLFGSVDEARRSLRHSVHRREERIHMREKFEALLQDLRYAVRGFQRQPSFAAAVVLTLALGIGANATIFGIVDRLLLRPPAHLVRPAETGRVYLTSSPEGESRTTDRMAYRRYLDLREETKSFAQSAAFFQTEMIFGVGENARQANAALVSASFWPLFGVRPALGRFFSPAEDIEPSGSPVAVLGHGYWQATYGGDSAVLGQQIRIGGGSYTIVGVAPRGFSGIALSATAAFIPITAGATDMFSDRDRPADPWPATYNMTWMQMVARRAPGVSVEAAGADLSHAFQRSLERQRTLRPTTRTMEELRPQAMLGSILFDRGPKAGQDAKVATWVGGVALLVFLIACANVANLLLARAFQRRREIAVRIALGVSRSRLIGQLLTESLLLAAAGGVAGLLVAQLGGNTLRALLLPDVEWTGATFDGRVLGFAALAALVAGALTGLAPALQLNHPEVTGALKAGGREGSLRRSRLRTGLLVLQGAISVTLLVGAGLFVRSLHNVRNVDLGFDPERVIYLSADMRGTKLDSAEHESLRQRLVERARALPVVEAAGRTYTVPFYMTWSENLKVPGIDSTKLRDEFLLNAVGGDYFAAAGTRIVRGRAIGDEDRFGSPPVAVLSELAAHAIWPKEEAIGKCVKIGADTAPCRTVVGIARDIRRGLDEGPNRHVYIAIQQERERGGLFIRTRGEARRQSEAIRRDLQHLMPGAAYVDVKPLQDLVDPNIRPWRLGAMMFSLFGVLALLVATVGLYSVIAYSVAQRTHELGVRIALGAETRDVLRLVVGEGTRVAIVGITLGVAAALLAGRYVTSLLYEVSAKDPLTFGVVIVTLLVVAIVASLVPARRAARVDPNVALRAD